MRYQNILKAIVIAGYMLSWPLHVQADAGAAGFISVKPGDLEWVEDPRRPGIRMARIEGDPQKAGPYIVRIKFPANYVGKAHWHPDVDRNTVISGVFYFGLGDKLDESKAVAYPAGSVTVLPARVNHFLFTREETVIQVHGMGPQVSHPAGKSPKK
jgi:hypothetical protein